MAAIEFIQSGALTLIQDGGRFAYQYMGMPVSGAADRYAMYLANVLVGNLPDAAIIECTLLGPTIKIEPTCVFAITGADMAARLNGQAIEPNRAYTAPAGSTLALGAAKSLVRSYIAFSGGMNVTKTLGSSSTYERAAIGGINGRKILPHDRIELVCPKAELKNMHFRFAPHALIPAYSSNPILRVTPAPQSDYITAAGLNTLFTSEYRVMNQSDRMGLRLEGKSVEFCEGKGASIISEAVALGAVQIPSGKPIIMLADHQTTGGYAVPCSVIEADIPLAAQLKGGDTVRFTPVTVEEAQLAHRKHMRLLYEFSDMLEHGFTYHHKPYFIQKEQMLYNISVEEIKPH